MKQRVSLARAFFKKTPILLLDEPTKELDAVLCERVCDMIKATAEERLVILVTHKEDDLPLLGGEIIEL
jgi:ABC-type transport system involved in cytochrome bd biosynthesis fused ATPase/permease subunit